MRKFQNELRLPPILPGGSGGRGMTPIMMNATTNDENFYYAEEELKKKKKNPCFPIEYPITIFIDRNGIPQLGNLMSEYATLLSVSVLTGHVPIMTQVRTVLLRSRLGVTHSVL